MRYETVEEFVARGGKIERVGYPFKLSYLEPIPVKLTSYIADRNGNPVKYSRLFKP